MLEAAVRSYNCEGCVDLTSRFLKSAENAGVCISRALCINDVLSAAFNRAGAVVENGKYLRHAKNAPPVVEGVESLDMVIPMLCEWIRQCFAMLEDGLADSGERDMRQAKAFIQAHYAEPLRLDEVAACVNLSPTYFCAKFKKETGQTFIEYLTDVRLEEAEVLLTGSSMKIGQIAEQVGFQDARHFSRIFQQKKGVLPSTFRRTGSEPTNPKDDF